MTLTKSVLLFIVVSLKNILFQNVVANFPFQIFVEDIFHYMKLQTVLLRIIFEDCFILFELYNYLQQDELFVRAINMAVLKFNWGYIIRIVSDIILDLKIKIVNFFVLINVMQ